MNSFKQWLEEHTRNRLFQEYSIYIPNVQSAPKKIVPGRNISSLNNFEMDGPIWL